MPTLLPSARTHPWRWLLAILVLALVLAAAQRGYLAWRQHALEPLAGARWIWADGTLASFEPSAFFAVRDFDLEAPPSHATLLIAADEVYVLWLNGRLVGSNSYLPGTPADRYSVAPFLTAGRNRIVVELRSSRSAGGLIAALRLGEPEKTIGVTDASWRIFRRWGRELSRNRRLGKRSGEAPVVWGAQPTGRWRLALPATTRPTFPTDLRQTRSAAPVRFRETTSDMPWHLLTPEQRRAGFSDPVKLLDWGQEVEGYLTLELRPHAGQLGLVFFGSEPPDPKIERPSEILIAVDGHRPWRSAHPRRFRYVLLVGGDLRAIPRVELLDSATAAELAPRPLEIQGLWGLAPALDRLKVEELAWGKVSRAAQTSIEAPKARKSRTPASKAARPHRQGRGKASPRQPPSSQQPAAPPA